MIWRGWFTPRSHNPLIMYRELAIRIFLPIALLFRGSALFVGGYLSEPAVFFVLTGLFILFAALSYVALLRGRISWSGLFLLLLFVRGDLATLFFNGYWDSSIITLGVINILLAGVLLSSKYFDHYALALIATYLLAILLVDLGGNTAPPGEPSLWLTLRLTFVFLAFTWVAVRYLKRRLEHYISTQQALIHSLEKEIQQRSAVEASLRESEERFRLISSLTSDYTFTSQLDENGKFNHVFLTGAFETITGYTPEAFLANGGWHNIIHPEDTALDKRHLAAMYENRPIETELRIIRKDGEIRWVRVQAAPIWDEEENRLVGINGAVQDITAQKQITKDLRESEQRYRSLIEAFPDIVTVSDYDGNWLYVNPAFEKKLGHTMAQMQALGGRAGLVHPDDWELVSGTIRDLIESDRQHSDVIENRIVVDGVTYWYRGILSKIHYEGKPALMVITRDITERKLTEQALLNLNIELEDRARQLAALYDIAYNVSTITDVRSTIKQALVKLQATIPLDAFFVVLHDEETNTVTFPVLYDEGQFWEQEPGILSPGGWVAQVLRTGKPMLLNRTQEEVDADAKKHTRLGDESKVSASVLMTPLPLGKRNIGVLSVQSYTFNSYDEKHLELLVGAGYQIAIAIENARLYDSLRDELAERKRLEAQLQDYTNQLEQLVDERTNALRRAKEQLELILNTTTDALAFADPKGDILLANPAFLATFDENASRAIEGILPSLADDDQTQAICEALLRVMYNNETQQLEAQVYSRSDQEKDIDLTLIPVQIVDDDTRKGVLLSGHDITALKAVERFKSRFVADVVHDLATPISGLSTRLHLLKRDPDNLASHASALDNQVKHLRSLLEDLRTLSQLDRGQIVLNLEMCSMDDLLQRIFDTYEPVALDKEQSLNLHIPSSLPRVKVDARQIERALVNLVANAVIYTPPHKSIKIAAANNNRWMTIKVIDEGTGIKAEDLPHIFDRFYRADDARDKVSSGTGLGLAITREIVQLHGGEISVNSEVNKGSTFEMRLPL